MNSSSIICPIAANRQKLADRPALSSKSEQLTYSQLESLVRKMTKIFIDSGVVAGDRVAILSSNSPLVVATLFALQRLSASAVFLNLQLSANDWKEQLTDAGVRLLVGQENLLDKLADCSVNKLTERNIQQLLSSSPEIDSTESFHINPENESCIVFTSSQTGHKKGVRLSLNNFISSATASNEITKLSAGDCWAASLPFYHVGGLGILYRTLIAGASSHILDDFSPKTILQLLVDQQLTHLSVVPTVLEALIDLAVKKKTTKGSLLPNLKVAILAGAASTASLIEKITEHQLPILSAWGMTETTAHCTCMTLNDPIDRIRSVGKPFKHTYLKLVDEHGEPVESGQTGEILVKGPTVCMGYLNSLAPQPFTQDGWLITNDLGILDSNGYLKIIGRKDDMFISGGENIHASEIEAQAICYPHAKHVAVIAVEHPKWGQRPILFVEPRSSVAIDSQHFLDFLKARLSKIKLPDRIISLTELPRTAIGKIDYKKLKQHYT